MLKRASSPHAKSTDDLSDIHRRLRTIYAAAVAVQLALRHQSAEQDLELADALRVGVCNSLGEVLQELEVQPPQPAASARPRRQRR